MHARAGYARRVTTAMQPQQPQPAVGPQSMMPIKARAPGAARALGITLLVLNGLIILNAGFGVLAALFMPGLYANMPGMSADAIAAMTRMMEWGLIVNGANLVAALVTVFGAIALMKAKPNAPQILYAGYGIWALAIIAMTVVMLVGMMPAMIEMQQEVIKGTPGGGGPQGDAMLDVWEDLGTPIAIISSGFYVVVWIALVWWSTWVLKQERTKRWLRGELEPVANWSQYHQPGVAPIAGAPAGYAPPAGVDPNTGMGPVAGAPGAPHAPQAPPTNG